MTLTVAFQGRLVQVPDQRGGRVLLTVLSLLERISTMDQGKLTLCWGADSSIKWSLESFGHDSDLQIGATTT